MYEIVKNGNFYFGRIPKNKARKLYKNSDIIIVPKNMRPLNIMCNQCIIPKDVDFDKFVNEYEYYNCNNECGKYSAFYSIVYES